MEDLKEKTKDLVDHAGDFADTFYRLTKVNLTQKAANIGSGAILAVVLSVIGIFSLFFAGCAFAFWLGDLLHSRAGGFLLAAGIFIIILLILIFLRKNTLIPFMRDFIVRKLYD